MAALTTAIRMKTVNLLKLPRIVLRTAHTNMTMSPHKIPLFLPMLGWFMIAGDKKLKMISKTEREMR